VKSGRGTSTNGRVEEEQAPTVIGSFIANAD